MKDYVITIKDSLNGKQKIKNKKRDVEHLINWEVRGVHPLTVHLSSIL